MAGQRLAVVPTPEDGIGHISDIWLVGKSLAAPLPARGRYELLERGTANNQQVG